MSAVRVGSVADFALDAPLAVTVEGVQVAVVRTDEGFFAIQDRCSHANVKLSEGEVDGCELECWLHGSMFDLRTGKPSGPPATAPVPVYPVTLAGDDVLVDVSPEA
ncbi:3-phenylpropionate/trans-cinnamate dioxygenase ferredoxin subunit [Motilibacter peucedani]|uniref:3-phenylpropionate/trans-cinnamate dioxygenase ferredoxin subunit n=1 Tax=Motilibacter peucedani TaxID=598650 RepID=A0A420XVE6_9ACTN|nr:non-heme iron oxygenase ferredoxin subunit [Motilibacter peucedani]RKS84190.1 3-phenylpropionate/trans-cinnamate dioxygenase ferredoxin subunit [Motilibacter peucedani]